MSHLGELDRIIASLAKPLAGYSDLLLDLRVWAREPSRAGSCMRAYFSLLDEAPAPAELAALQRWFEQHLSICVFDGSREIFIEKLPLELEGATSLEKLCQGAMHRMHEDRCHEYEQIRMEFGFVSKWAMVAA